MRSPHVFMTFAATRKSACVFSVSWPVVDPCSNWPSVPVGSRFRLRRKVLQRTYSHRLSDYALEFYSFVADNYAPFYSTPIECTDRDAAYVLDGLLYNESDLALEEHFTDTHGYTEINFAAFAMLGVASRHVFEGSNTSASTACTRPWGVTSRGFKSISEISGCSLPIRDNPSKV